VGAYFPEHSQPLFRAWLAQDNGASKKTSLTGADDEKYHLERSRNNGAN